MSLDLLLGFTGLMTNGVAKEDICVQVMPSPP